MLHNNTQTIQKLQEQNNELIEINKSVKKQLEPGNNYIKQLNNMFKSLVPQLALANITIETMPKLEALENV